MKKHTDLDIIVRTHDLGNGKVELSVGSPNTDDMSVGEAFKSLCEGLIHFGKYIVQNAEESSDPKTMATVKRITEMVREEVNKHEGKK